MTENHGVGGSIPSLGTTSSAAPIVPQPTLTAFAIAWFRSDGGRRARAIGLAVLVEALLLFVLLTFNDRQPVPPKVEEVITVADLVPVEPETDTSAPAGAQPASRPDAPAPAQAPAAAPSASDPAQPAPAQPQPSTPEPASTPPAILPVPFTLPPSRPAAPAAQPPSAPSTARMYGPPDVGGSPALRDSVVVGSAPNGEPLYAAAWHREPRPDTLRDYLSTASGPGWGLIACRTAPNYRVVDCVPLDEYPTGSQINRAILAAAWEFEVRPPRRGGQLLVGAWVRIRIDYRRGAR